MTEKKVNEPIEPGDNGESAEVRKARDATEIAELKAREEKAKADASAHAIGMTPEQFREAQRGLLNNIANMEATIAERTREEKERLIDATSKQVEALQAYHERSQQYEPVDKANKKTIKEQKEWIAELETQSGIKKEEEAKRISDEVYFDEHLEQVKIYLIKIVGKIAPYEKSLAVYLNRQALKLNKEIGFKRGRMILKACSQSLVKSAAWFQDNSETIKEYDASSISDKLCKADDYLLGLMKMQGARKTKEERAVKVGEEYPNEYQYKSAYPEEEPMTHGGQDGIINRFLDKLDKA